MNPAVSTRAPHDAVYIGGPRDGTLFRSDQVPLVEVEIDGLLHRYIRTTKQRDSYLVYNYDGEIDPEGAQPGVETRRQDRT